jgi:hypothetical protein
MSQIKKLPPKLKAYKVTAEPTQRTTHHDWQMKLRKAQKVIKVLANRPNRRNKQNSPQNKTFSAEETVEINALQINQ